MDESKSKAERKEDITEAKGDGEAESLPEGIIRELGELGPGAIITEAGLARMFGRHPVSIKRAVKRGELPPPCHFLGKPRWLVGTILDHLEKRLADAAKDAEKLNRRMSQLSP